MELVKSSLGVLGAYALIFLPLFVFLFMGLGLHFICYGAAVAILNTLACLMNDIRKNNQMGKGKR